MTDETALHMPSHRQYLDLILRLIKKIFQLRYLPLQRIVLVLGRVLLRLQGLLRLVQLQEGLFQADQILLPLLEFFCQLCFLRNNYTNIIFSDA